MLLFSQVQHSFYNMIHQLQLQHSLYPTFSISEANQIVVPPHVPYMLAEEAAMLHIPQLTVKSPLIAVPMQLQ